MQMIFFLLLYALSTKDYFFCKTDKIRYKEVDRVQFWAYGKKAKKSVQCEWISPWDKSSLLKAKLEYLTNIN